jgi:hypothetical protein
MELLSWSVLDVVFTAVVVSGVIALLVSFAAFVIRAVPRGSFLILLLAVFAFSMLGFVTGELLGDSRDSAVGAVVPAVLTLFGSVAAYIISSRGVRSQTAVSASVICFVFCFLIGSLFGIQLRNDYEDYLQDPTYLGAREVALERNRAAVEVERLDDYVRWVQLRQLYADHDKLDLSKFRTLYEEGPPANGEQAQTSPAAKSSSAPTAGAAK